MTFGKEKDLDAANTEALETNNTASKSIDSKSAIQVLAERMDTFKRLERAFDAAGWNLFYLDGESCLAVERRWQMNKVCPDLRSAASLLKQIGGAL